MAARSLSKSQRVDGNFLAEHCILENEATKPSSHATPPFRQITPTTRNWPQRPIAGKQGPHSPFCQEENTSIAGLTIQREQAGHPICNELQKMLVETEVHRA